MSETIDYGPLEKLAGTWKGDKGKDVSPEPDGEEINPYFETILFEKCGDVTNAEKQTLAVVRYHQVVSRKSNGQVFHNETGYLTWDAASKTVTQNLAIPRGVTLVAQGVCEAPSSGAFTVKAEGAAIAQSPFMQEKATTLAFSHEIAVSGDELSYSESTLLSIYGRQFEHTDRNTLKRV